MHVYLFFLFLVLTSFLIYYSPFSFNHLHFFLPFLAYVFLRALLIPQKETAQLRTPQVGLGVERKVTRIRHQQKNTRTGLSEFLQA